MRPVHALSSIALISLVACAANAPAVRPPADAGVAAESTSADPEADLAKAEREVNRLLAPRGLALDAVKQTESVPKEQAPAPPPPPPSPTADTPSAQGHSDPSIGNAAGPAGSGDVCQVACTALASMERAASRLCSLAGDKDARCEGAKGRVQSATARVHAACPACSS
jgi:hypothetical protein